MLRQTPVFLGIDPGLHGAFVVYDAAEKAVINARIIPTLVLKRNGKQRLTLDVPSLVLITRELAGKYPNLQTFLELVGAHRMHGRTQGASSMFTFGDTYGSIKTALVAAGLSYSLVTPASWKAALACPSDKDASLDRANQLIPTSTVFWTPKRGVITKEACKGVAEAAMIAFYGAQRAENQAVLRAA